MPESWVFGANDPQLGRGLNHLPYAVFLHPETHQPRIGAGIGACVLDLSAISTVMPAHLQPALSESSLNSLMSLGPAAWQQLRTTLQHLLSRDNKDRTLIESALLDARSLSFTLPCIVGDYTDFYASRHHAMRVGELFRPEQPLLENYDWIPIAYHGRASSLVISGTNVRRPQGQMKTSTGIHFAATRRLDYEVELACFIGAGNSLGQSISLAHAPSHLFGVSLLNDWSARDVQAWEYQPLGPFLGKNFATTVSPWITPLAALEHCRTAPPAHPAGLLPYLDDPHDRHSGALCLTVEVQLTTQQSRAANLQPFAISAANASTLWWTLAQMVSHHTANGCNLRPGDLLATGTISGEPRDQSGCMLELTRGGREPLTLPNGEQRSFLEEGDEVILIGQTNPPGELPIRLGECRGRILPAESACTNATPSPST